MKITILGSGSATPTLDRFHSSILLEHHDQLYLFDCGEGVQWQMLRYDVKFSKLNHIFITHLHGDHYLGLIGLLSTLHSWGRERDLYIYAPPGLREILTIQFKYQQTFLKYNIVLLETNHLQSNVICTTKHLEVTTIPLSHRIPCTGFLCKERPQPLNLIREKVPTDISLANIQLLKSGQDVLDEKGNVVYQWQEYTYPATPLKTFAYCTDTIFDPGIVDYIKGVDLLYHEATFLDDKELRAGEVHHSTASQAGTIAAMAGAKKLVIGHFSARYNDVQPFLDQAQKVFYPVFLSEEGKVFEI